MKIVVAHNFYQQPGGEDQVYHAEVALLREFGHDVVPFEVHNDAVAGMGKLGLARATVWNGEIAGRIGELVRRERADVVHFHNTFPLISPASYYAARRAGAAVVQDAAQLPTHVPGGPVLPGRPAVRGLPGQAARLARCGPRLLPRQPGDDGRHGRGRRHAPGRRHVPERRRRLRLPDRLRPGQVRPRRTARDQVAREAELRPPRPRPPPRRRRVGRVRRPAERGEGRPAAAGRLGTTWTCR